MVNPIILLGTHKKMKKKELLGTPLIKETFYRPLAGDLLRLGDGDAPA